MPLDALALLLGAAGAHATWNLFAKNARNDLAFNFAIVLASSLIYVPVAIGIIVVARPEIGWDALGFIGVSSFFHIAYYVALTRGYLHGDLSLVYPLARGTGPVLAIIGAIILYGERPGIIALGGAALITCGIIFMSWPSGNGGGATKPIARSVGFALLTGGITATYTLWDKKGVETLTPVLYGYGLELTRALILAPLALSTRFNRRAVVATFREQRRPLVAIAVLSPGAYMMVLAALSIAPVSYIAPGREISILFGALIGLRLLGARDATRRIAGATAIVAGIFALALG